MIQGGVGNARATLITLKSNGSRHYDTTRFRTPRVNVEIQPSLISRFQLWVLLTKY